MLGGCSCFCDCLKVAAQEAHSAASPQVDQGPWAAVAAEDPEGWHSPDRQRIGRDAEVRVRVRLPAAVSLLLRCKQVSSLSPRCHLRLCTVPTAPTVPTSPSLPSWAELESWKSRKSVPRTQPELPPFPADSFLLRNRFRLPWVSARSSAGDGCWAELPERGGSPRLLAEQAGGQRPRFQGTFSLLSL